MYIKSYVCKIDVPIQVLTNAIEEYLKNYFYCFDFLCLIVVDLYICRVLEYTEEV
jgi:hypothetical protein